MLHSKKEKSDLQLFVWKPLLNFGTTYVLIEYVDTKMMVLLLYSLLFLMKRYKRSKNFKNFKNCRKSKITTNFYTVLVITALIKVVYQHFSYIFSC